MDPITLTVGAVILGVGYVTGRIGRKKTKTASDPNKPVCGCGHGLHAHDPKSSVCNATVRVSKYNPYGDWVGHEYKPCACKQYIGPKEIDLNKIYLPPTFEQQEGGA